MTVKEYAGGEIGDLVTAFNSMTAQMKTYTTELYLFLIPACELKVFPKDKYHKNYYNLRLYYYPYQKR